MGPILKLQRQNWRVFQGLGVVFKVKDIMTGKSVNVPGCWGAREEDGGGYQRGGGGGGRGGPGGLVLHPVHHRAGGIHLSKNGGNLHL